jgi:Zn finger protein HypA/HybF involved in hydrogenase expression
MISIITKRPLSAIQESSEVKCLHCNNRLTFFSVSPYICGKCGNSMPDVTDLLKLSGRISYYFDGAVGITSYPDYFG